MLLTLPARKAAHQQGETKEELHSMDYLSMRISSSGRARDAEPVIQQMQDMARSQSQAIFTARASTVMADSLSVARSRWSDAARLFFPWKRRLNDVARVWSRGVGLPAWTRTRRNTRRSRGCGQIEEQLGASGNSYWAKQAGILRREVWRVRRGGEKKPGGSRHLAAGRRRRRRLRIEKLPVTPGPIVPEARTLGELLRGRITQAAAAKEFQTH